MFPQQVVEAATGLLGGGKKKKEKKEKKRKHSDIAEVAEPVPEVPYRSSPASCALGWVLAC